MKRLAPFVIALLLSVGLVAAPTSAAEPEPPVVECPVVEPLPMDGPDVIAELIELRAGVARLDGKVAFLEDQRRIDARTITRQARQLERQQVTIKRLRAELRSLRR